jgi:Flp pilus assembly protein TadG
MKADRDRGSLSIVMMFLIIVVLGGAALVVDGGRAMTARRHAANTAEAAARSGVASQSLAVGFDADAAAAVARSVALRSGVEGADVDVRFVDGTRPQLIVTITEHPGTVFLVLGGADEMTVRASGSAIFVYSV